MKMKKEINDEQLLNSQESEKADYDRMKTKDLKEAYDRYGGCIR